MERCRAPLCATERSSQLRGAVETIAAVGTFRDIWDVLQPATFNLSKRVRQGGALPTYISRARCAFGAHGAQHLFGRNPAGGSKTPKKNLSRWRFCSAARCARSELMCSAECEWLALNWNDELQALHIRSGEKEFRSLHVEKRSRSVAA